MFRKDSQLTVIQARKKLLVAESEVNRAELLREIGALKGEITHIKKQMRTISSIASSAALVATAFSLFRNHRSSAENSHGPKKTSWITAALAGARIGTSLFLKIKSMLRERERE
jgi:hypothetical protein